MQRSSATVVALVGSGAGGVLGGLGRAGEVPAALRRLPAGRWWPEPGRLPEGLEGVERQAPDALVTPEPDARELLRPGR